MVWGNGCKRLCVSSNPYANICIHRIPFKGESSNSPTYDSGFPVDLATRADSSFKMDPLSPPRSTLVVRMSDGSPGRSQWGWRSGGDDGVDFSLALMFKRYCWRRMLLLLETNGVKDETDDRRDRIDVRRMNEDGTAFILYD